MTNTTLCYLIRDGRWLMLHRTKKNRDENAGKWIGVGGHFEEGESPDDCLLREVREETGFALRRYALRGIVTFVSDEWGTEQMFLYTADRFDGGMKVCAEGDLAWVPQADLMRLQLWQGDRIFLRMLAENQPFFVLKLVYRGDELARAVCDGRELPLHSPEEDI